MVQTINGRLSFTYNCPKQPKKLNYPVKFKLSLLGILMGIFLLPNLAYLSDITPERLIDLTNLERQDNALIPLTANQLLTKAADLKARAILESQTFKHTINDKKFSSWVKEAGYNYSYVGENLAVDFATSEGVIEAWENSPLHKKNLLSPYYQEIGIAAVLGKFQGQDTTIVVQIFGAPASASVQPLTQNFGLSSPNLLPISSAINPINSSQTENLLAHSIISQEIMPLNNIKLTLVDNNLSLGQLNPVRELTGSALSDNNRQFELFTFSNGVNKFIVQPEYTPALNNFLMTFSLITLFYILLSLYYYYFLKINRLTAL